MSGRTIPHIGLTSIEVRTLSEKFPSMPQYQGHHHGLLWSLIWSCGCLIIHPSPRSHYSFEIIIIPEPNTSGGIVDKHTVPQCAGLLPSAPTPGSKVPLTGRVAFLSRGRDRCSTAGEENPWVFRTHPGGADRAGALLSTTTIIYWVRLLVEPGR